VWNGGLARAAPDAQGVRPWVNPRGALIGEPGVFRAHDVAAGPIPIVVRGGLLEYRFAFEMSRAADPVSGAWGVNGRAGVPTKMPDETQRMVEWLDGIPWPDMKGEIVAVEDAAGGKVTVMVQTGHEYDEAMRQLSSGKLSLAETAIWRDVLVAIKPVEMTLPNPKTAPLGLLSSDLVEWIKKFNEGKHGRTFIQDGRLVTQTVMGSQVTLIERDQWTESNPPGDFQVSGASVVEGAGGRVVLEGIHMPRGGEVTSITLKNPPARPSLASSPSSTFAIKQHRGSCFAHSMSLVDRARMQTVPVDLVLREPDGLHGNTGKVTIAQVRDHFERYGPVQSVVEWHLGAVVDYDGKVIYQNAGNYKHRVTDGEAWDNGGDGAIQGPRTTLTEESSAARRKRILHHRPNPRSQPDSVGGFEDPETRFRAVTVRLDARIPRHIMIRAKHDFVYSREIARSWEKMVQIATPNRWADDTDLAKSGALRGERRAAVDTARWFVDFMGKCVEQQIK
jgi:hypothetical protein